MIRISNNKGFTIVEMIVAIGIFTMVAVAAVSALASVIDANRQTRSLAQANNNINFSLQTMVREIRNGFAYGCDTNNPSNTEECSASQFGFVNSARDDVVYEKDGNKIKRSENSGQGKSLTPDEVTVNHLEFDVKGAENNQEQSRVIITVEVETGREDNREVVNLQTTATQRLLFTPSS